MCFLLEYVGYWSREADFPITNDCQGHMQTPQSLSVVSVYHTCSFSFSLTAKMWNKHRPNGQQISRMLCEYHSFAIHVREDSSFLGCYAISAAAYLTDVSKDFCTFILRVKQSTGYFFSLAWPWRWRHYDLSKRREVPNDTASHPTRLESSPSPPLSTSRVA